MSEISLDPAEHADFIRDAKAEGHGIIMGGPDVLQLDLDDAIDRDRALDRILRFYQNIGITKVYETRSKSDNSHFHIFLDKPMGRRDRMFWQCALGSDGVRELLHWVRFENGLDLEAFFVEISGAKMELLFDFTDKSEFAEEDIPF